MHCAVGRFLVLYEPTHLGSGTRFAMGAPIFQIDGAINLVVGGVAIDSETPMVALSIPKSSSLSKVLIGVGCACVRS